MMRDKAGKAAHKANRASSRGSDDLANACRRCLPASPAWTRSRAAAFQKAGRRWCAVRRAAQDAPRHGVPGARRHRVRRPGAFIAFEETAEELAQNVRSLGFDLDELQAKEKIAIDYVRIERSEIEETGEFDLEGLFVRLALAIDSIGAKRVVLDTIETLFGGFNNQRSCARSCGACSAG